MDTDTDSNTDKSSSTVMEHKTYENLPVYETSGPRRLKRTPSKPESDVIDPEPNKNDQPNRKASITRKTSQTKNLNLMGLEGTEVLDGGSGVCNKRRTSFDCSPKLIRKTSLTRKISLTKNLNTLGDEENAPSKNGLK